MGYCRKPSEPASPRPVAWQYPCARAHRGSMLCRTEAEGCAVHSAPARCDRLLDTPNIVWAPSWEGSLACDHYAGF